jgi:hypothetical protein
MYVSHVLYVCYATVFQCNYVCIFESCVSLSLSLSISLSIYLYVCVYIRCWVHVSVRALEAITRE